MAGLKFGVHKFRPRPARECWVLLSNRRVHRFIRSGPTETILSIVSKVKYTYIDFSPNLLEISARNL
jgi:hypothetical protein